MRAVLLTSLALLPFASLAQTPDKVAVETIVKEYLMAHPDVVVDALNAYQEKKMQESQAATTKAIAERKKELTEDKNAPSIGPKNADVVIVEFFDYHCGYCKRVLPVMAELLKQDKKLRIVFRELPILSEDSKLASKAALAVYQIKPDQYFAYHTALMQATGGYSMEMLKAEAVKLGVDGKKFEAAVNSKAVEDELKTNDELAKALNIRGTPAFIVGNDLLPGAVDLEAFKKAIAEARGKKS